MSAFDNEKSRLDDAARAGWLYFIAGHTQDEIAKRLSDGSTKEQLAAVDRVQPNEQQFSV